MSVATTTRTTVGGRDGTGAAIEKGRRGDDGGQQQRAGRQRSTGGHRAVDRLSEDFYLICFAEQTGQALVTDAVAGLGLACELLAESVLGGHLIVHEGLVYPAAGAGAPADVTLREILRAVAGQRRPQEVGTWLRFLDEEAVTDVRNRMCATGLLARVRTRRLTGGREAYLPTDSNAAVWPAIRLANQLCAGGPVPLPDAVLAGRVAATGLLKHVLWAPEHALGFGNADRLTRQLPAPLASVVAHTEAAVGQHVLTRRRL